MAKGKFDDISLVLKKVSVTQALAAATAYHANDVMCSNATTGVKWTFAEVAERNGEKGAIVKALVQSESEGIIPRITLYLFNVAPTTVDEDHAANTNPDAADLAKYIGKIDFPALESLGTTDSNATVTPSTVGGLPLAFECASGADDLIGIAVTRDAFTQTATDDLTFTLTIERF